MEGGIFLIISADGPILYCFVPYSCENYVAMTSSKIFDFMITFMKKKHCIYTVELKNLLFWNRLIKPINEVVHAFYDYWLVNEGCQVCQPVGHLAAMCGLVINNRLFSNLPFSIKSTTWFIFLPLQSKVPIRPLRPHVRPGWNLPKTEIQVLRNENQFALYHTILYNITSNI